MPWRAADHSYINLSNLHRDQGSVPVRRPLSRCPPLTAQWYWHSIARAASCMVVAGYLVSPALYDRDPQLRVSSALLAAVVVALLTAGYSSTALLCFACRDVAFHADAVFRPALLASALGLLTVAYSFAASARYTLNLAAIVAISLPVLALLFYALMLLLARRRVRFTADPCAPPPAQFARSPSARTTYTTWTALSGKTPPQPPSRASTPTLAPTLAPTLTPTLTPTRSPGATAEDERINQQMALLLQKSDPGPSPDATSATFHIDLPQHSGPAAHAAHYGAQTLPPPLLARSRSDAAEFADAPERGRLAVRPVSVGGPALGRDRSREQRRREIELGALRC